MEINLSGLFRQLTHGVYVIGVSSGEEDNAFTASWVMQASFDPLLLVVSIHPQHSSYKLLIDGGAFSVNVLAADRMDLAALFGREANINKLDHVSWHRSSRGVPVIDDAMASFECIYSHQCEAGDHRLVVGRVTGGEIMDPAATPMNYRDTGDMDGSSRLYPAGFSDKTGK